MKPAQSVQPRACPICSWSRAYNHGFAQPSFLKETCELEDKRLLPSGGLSTEVSPALSNNSLFQSLESHLPFLASIDPSTILMSTRTFSTTSSLDPGPTSPTGRAPVINIIDEEVTGYIQKARLEARLRSMFGYDIQVRVSDQPSTASVASAD
jgi:hypothetical protein